MPPYEKYVDGPESHEAVRRAHDDEQLKREAKIQLFTKAPEEMRGQYFEVSQKAYELFRSDAKMVRKYFAGVHQLSISITPWWTGWKNKPALRGYYAPEFCSFARDAFENLMGQRYTKAQLPNNFSHRTYGYPDEYCGRWGYILEWQG